MLTLGGWDDADYRQKDVDLMIPMKKYCEGVTYSASQLLAMEPDIVNPELRRSFGNCQALKSRRRASSVTSAAKIADSMRKMGEGASRSGSGSQPAPLAITAAAGDPKGNAGASGHGERKDLPTLSPPAPVPKNPTAPPSPMPAGAPPPAPAAPQNAGPHGGLIDFDTIAVAFDESEYLGWDPASTVRKCEGWSSVEMTRVIVYYVQLSGGYNEKKLKKRDQAVKALLTRLNIMGSLGSGNPDTLTLSRIASAHPILLAGVRSGIVQRGRKLREILVGRPLVWQDMALMPIALAGGCSWAEDFIDKHARLFCKDKKEDAKKAASERAIEIQKAVPAPSSAIVERVKRVLGAF